MKGKSKCWRPALERPQQKTRMIFLDQYRAQTGGPRRKQATDNEQIPRPLEQITKPSSSACNSLKICCWKLNCGSWEANEAVVFWTDFDEADDELDDEEEEEEEEEREVVEEDIQSPETGFLTKPTPPGFSSAQLLHPCVSARCSVVVINHVAYPNKISRRYVASVCLSLENQVDVWPSLSLPCLLSRSSFHHCLRRELVLAVCICPTFILLLLC
jgi:hypothetical protein